MNEPRTIDKELGLPNPAEQYLPQLDGIRGLAIALVLMVHCYGRGPDPQLSQVPGGAFVAQLLGLGWAGVELFFVLSGLLVTSMLLRRKRLEQPLGPFFARRLARIVPGYVLVVSAIAMLSFVALDPLVDPITAQAGSLWPYYVLFLNNYFGLVSIDAVEADKILGPMWSVASEMQYYLIWPLIVMAFSESRIRLLVPLVLAGSVALRLLAIGSGISASGIYFASITHLDGILVGSFLALHWDRLAGFSRRFAGPGLAASITALSLLLWTAGTTYKLDPLVQSWGYTLVACVSAFLVLRAVSAPATAKLLGCSPLRLLGRYSYFIYLVHLPILVALDQVVPWQGLFWWLVYYVLVIIGLVAIGAVSWRYFEQPIIRWNQRREGSRKSILAARPGQ